MIDAIDAQILNILQGNARTPNAEIARQIGMAPSAVLERLRKLEERGVIAGYGARINPRALGLGLVAFIAVRADEGPEDGDTAAILAQLPEVQEVHHIAGEDCFLVKVRVADTETLGALLRDRIKVIPTVRSTRTTIVLNTVKETTDLPVAVPDTAEAR